MPPSIVITEPVPRWKAWARDLFYVAALLLLSGVSFYVGVQYQRLQHARAATQQVIAPSPRAAEIAQRPEPAEMLAALGVPRSIEGLQIQSLGIASDDTVPGQWRYEFVVGNEGRPYEGHFEFLVLGLQDGRPVQWVFPAQEQRVGAAFRLRIARYLKTAGQIQLPPGLTPQAVALRLHETSGVRASRGLVLPAESAHAGAAPLAPSAQ